MIRYVIKGDLSTWVVCKQRIMERDIHYYYIEYTINQMSLN